jgi:hypothetical protein
VKKRPRSTGAKRRAFGRFRKNRTIFSLGDAAGGLSLWFVSLSAMRKRNKQALSKPLLTKLILKSLSLILFSSLKFLNCSRKHKSLKHEAD